MPAAIFLLAEVFVPAANFVLVEIFVPEEIFVLKIAGIFVPAATLVLASRNICVLFVLLLYVPKSSTLAMARRSAHLITSFPGNLEEAVNQYFVMGARVLDSRPLGRGFEPHWWRCIAPLSKTHLS